MGSQQYTKEVTRPGTRVLTWRNVVRTGYQHVLGQEIASVDRPQSISTSLSYIFSPFPSFLLSRNIREDGR